MALYFRAAALWKAGDVKDAIATLERLVELAPGVERYYVTLEKIRKAKPKEEGFFSISMSMNLLNE